MEVTVYKCETCGVLIEDLTDYEQHMKVHRKQALLAEAFPAVEDTECRFSSGEYCVQRNSDWLARYKRAVEEIVGPNSYTPWSYAWFRCLDDGDSPYYIAAMRALNICPTCFREWGQSFHADHCEHTA